MSEISKNFETIPKRFEVAKRQIQATEALADIYSENDSVDAVFAGVLNNPIYYATSDNIDSLPKDLKDRWDNFGLLCAYFVVNVTSETRTDGWSDPMKAIQDIINSGVTDPITRDAICGITVGASNLFAESTKFKSGDTRRFERNVEKLESQIPVA